MSSVTHIISRCHIVSPAGGPSDLWFSHYDY